MGIHQETHPSYVDDCDMCRWSSISVAPSATPSRKGGQEAANVNATEKRWHKDMDAYATLRGQGTQPRGIDGAAELAARAEDKFEVESGHTLKTKQARAFAKDVIAEMNRP